MNFLKAHFEKIAFTILILWIASSAITTMSSNTNGSQATRFLLSLKDSDRDGMEDAWEIKHGLNHLKNDADLDPDQDGFTNLEEYGTREEDRSSPKDSEDHPFLFTKLKLVKVTKKPLPFRFMALSVNDITKKKTWDLQVKSSKDSFKRIGDKLPLNIEILDIELNKKNESKSLIILFSEKYGVFKVPIEKKIFPPNPITVHFDYTVPKKTQRIIFQVKPHKSFGLKNRQGKNTETYSLKKANKGKVLLHLEEYGLKIKVTAQNASMFGKKSTW